VPTTTRRGDGADGGLSEHGERGRETATGSAPGQVSRRRQSGHVVAEPRSENAVSRRRFLHAAVGGAVASAVAAAGASAAAAPSAAGSTVAGPGVPPGGLPDRRHRVEIVDSTKSSDPPTPRSGPQGPVRADEFSIVGVYDVDWLLEPRFQRLLDNMAASPGAFKTVRFFGSLSSGTLENNVDDDPPAAAGGVVWPSVDAPMDFSATFRALETLTSRGLTPFVVLTFFPPAVSDRATSPPASFDDWKRLVRGFLDQLAADPRFGESAIRDWWFEVWNEPNMGGFWAGSFASISISIGRPPRP
jgi:Glycosyl hydrolases family 39